MDTTRFLQKLCTICILSVILCALVPHGSAITLNPVGSGSTMPVIANGDPVTITGIATGQPREGLQVWIVGKNYLRIDSVAVNRDNSFEYELRPSDTQNLAAGQYYVVIQHPMMNGVFDVYYDASTGKVYNRQLVGGTSIYQMSGSGSLQGPDSAQALVNAISSQNVDDSFTSYTFMISPPTAFINPIGDRTIGERFTITGATNLAPGNILMVDITSSSFGPTQKSAGGGFSGVSGQAAIVPGTGGYNRWSFDVDTSTFRPDEYIVKVSAVTIDATASTIFLVTERAPSAPVTPEPAPPVTPEITEVTKPAPPVAPTTPARSSLAVSALLPAIAAAFLLRREGR
jgi:hypothetical protein